MARANKIVTIIAYQGQGGIEKVVRENYDGEIVIVSEGNNRIMKSQYGILFAPKLFLKISKYNIIVSNLPIHHMVISIYCRLMSKRHVCIEHGPWPQVLYHRSKFVKLFYEYWLRVTNSDIITVSKDIFALYRLYRVKNLKYIPNSTPPALYKKTKKGIHERFIFIGRMDYQKDPELAIELFIKYNEKFNPNSILDLYGEGAMLNILKERYDNLHCINFKGYQKKLNDKMHTYDVLIISSLFEGLPGVVLESLSRNLKVFSVPFLGGLIELNSCNCLCVGNSIEPLKLAIELNNFLVKGNDQFEKSTYSIENVKLKYEEILHT